MDNINQMGANMCGSETFTDQTLLNKLNTFGQQHLIEHFSEIQDPTKKALYLEQLNKIDFALMKQLYTNIYKNKPEKKPANFQPIINFVADLQSLQGTRYVYEKTGYRAIAEGQVAVCIMSGGQGTRLGTTSPKGMFDLGLQSHKTPFDYFSRKLQVLLKLAKKEADHFDKEKEIHAIPWYIMTSDINLDQIREYFHANDYFGYDKTAITFFPQGTLPALDFEGKIILEDEGKISLAPGGNGAIYYQMKHHGIIDSLKTKGVKYLHIGAIDNVLLKLADPACIGYMKTYDRQLLSKYTIKKNPDEKVGVHLLNNSQLEVCQYSELTQQQRNATNSEGELLHNKAFLAVYFISVSFLDRITSDEAVMERLNARYHLAEKKIVSYDRVNKKMIKTQIPNGIKFQLFCFDAFHISKKFSLFEVNREEQFAPIKNATGEDSPQTARKLISRLHVNWLSNYKVDVKNPQDALLEIDPSLTYSGQGLQTIAEKYQHHPIVLPHYIKPEQEISKI